MLKKLCIGICCIMALFMFGCTPNNGEPEGPEGSEINVETDLNLTVEVDKTTASVGDTIEITVTLKNLSGKDLYIALTGADASRSEELKDILRIKVCSEGEEPCWGDISIGVIPKKIKVLEKEATVQRVIEYQATGAGTFDIYSYMEFYTGKTYDTPASIMSEPIQIKIGG